MVHGLIKYGHFCVGHAQRTSQITIRFAASTPRLVIPPLVTQSEALKRLALMLPMWQQPSRASAFQSQHAELEQRLAARQLEHYRARIARLEAELKEARRVAAACERVLARAPVPNARLFPCLPLDCEARIVEFLPAHTRLICREVCCAWRDVLEDKRHWRTVHMTHLQSFDSSVLAAVSVRAEGVLTRFDAQFFDVAFREEKEDPLGDFVQHHGATLRRVTLSNADGEGVSIASVRRIVDGVPGLELFECPVQCWLHELPQLDELMAAHPCLRVTHAHTRACVYWAHQPQDANTDFVVGPENHGFRLKLPTRGWPSLPNVTFRTASHRVEYEPDVACAAVLRAVLQHAGTLCRMDIDVEWLTQTSVPPLCDLLLHGQLEVLVISGRIDEWRSPLVGRNAARIHTALKAAPRLTVLSIRDTGLFMLDGVSLLSALVGHATLQILHVVESHPTYDEDGCVATAFETLLTTPSALVCLLAEGVLSGPDLEYAQEVAAGARDGVQAHFFECRYGERHTPLAASLQTLVGRAECGNVPLSEVLSSIRKVGEGILHADNASWQCARPRAEPVHLGPAVPGER